MSSAKFEAQTAIFSALTSSSAFMTVAGSLYDTPPDNKTYPYVCLETSNETPFNRHNRKGWNVYMTFGIYTKPGLLGSYPTEQIKAAMDIALNLKRFSLTGTLIMVICKFFSCNDFKNQDIQGANVTYHVIVHDNANIN